MRGILISALLVVSPVHAECTKAAPTNNSLVKYYKQVEGKTSTELKAALNEITRGHTKHTYKCVWEILKETDEDPENSDNVIALYTSRSIPKSRQSTQVYDADSWNREHVWSKSKGFPKEKQHAYTDAHHLRPRK